MFHPFGVSRRVPLGLPFRLPLGVPFRMPLGLSLGLRERRFALT